MDYSWLIDLNKLISSTTLFSVTVVGAKSLAMTIILIRVVSNFLITGENPEAPKIGGIMNIIGYGLLIVGSDWIVNAIETMFAGIDLSLTTPQALPDGAIKQYLSKIEEGVSEMDVFDKMSFYISLLPLYLTAGLMTFFQELLRILDMGVVGMYLVQRVFLLQLFKVIFPFAIAFSTIKNDPDMLLRWVKIYIGLFFLGVAYTAILKFTDTIFTFVQERIGLTINQINYDTDLRLLFGYSIGALLISFMVKFSLFAIVTREVRNFFN
ncbi:hypothetical protein P0M11_12720 [Kaistella sp. PBT33-4]|uniref:hypothetical protein n=1 Tax=Kaistella sp. PBT33-4 TaxID=3032000 RepID=UPI0023D7CCCE|nr:hypothetical protein [Kaistella sp. PBT33-4]MDF0720863.1 hypothetical protein [Kaistella sp. PBT33-4]